MDSNTPSLKVNEKKLLEEGKLILFVDLDKTLVHSFLYNAQKAAEAGVARSKENALWFKSGSNQFQVTEIRNGTQRKKHKNLQNMEQLILQN